MTIVSGLTGFVAALVTVRVGIAKVVFAAGLGRAGTRSTPLTVSIALAIHRAAVDRGPLVRGDVVGGSDSLSLGDGILKAHSARSNGLDRVEVEGTAAGGLGVGGVLTGRGRIMAWGRASIGRHVASLWWGVGGSWVTLLALGRGGRSLLLGSFKESVVGNAS